MGNLTLDDLIEISLRQKWDDRKTYNQQRLGTQAQKYCQKITNRFCSTMPEDLHIDVFHQAFVELFALDPNVLVKRRGKAVFRRCIFSAIRSVKSQYAAPGERTRQTRKELPQKRIAAEHIGELVEGESLNRCTVKQGAHNRIDFDMIESRPAAIEMQQIVNRLDVQKLLNNADPSVARALYLICVDGERTDFAAADAGISRFALKRKFAALTALCLHAA